MSETLPPLPLDWTKRIFSRMTAVYGSQFSAKWDAENMDEVLSVWSDELRNFRDHPSAIKYALLHLPEDFPPNLQQFKSLCREGLKREEKPLALERKLTHEEIEFGRLKVEQLAREVLKPTNARKWIYDLRARINSVHQPSVAVMRILQEAELIEKNEHPETYAEFCT